MNDAYAQWQARSRAAVWHPCTQMKLHERMPLVPIARGARRVAVRSSRPPLPRRDQLVVGQPVRPRESAHQRRAHGQLDDLAHVMLAGFTHAPVIELSERLAALAPAGLGHAFYASDGASADRDRAEDELPLLAAARRARQAPLRARSPGGYHGETVGRARRHRRRAVSRAYGPLLRDNPVLPSPALRDAADARSPERAVDDALDALEAYLRAARRDDGRADRRAAGAGRRRHGDVRRALSRTARANCTRSYDVHLIADEIMTGFGRTGTMFACEQAAITPDFLCLSKGITGGYLPLSCVLATDAVFDAFYDDDVARGFLHSHSYTGNALACRAALAVLDIFRDDDVIVAQPRRRRRDGATSRRRSRRIRACATSASVE